MSLVLIFIVANGTISTIAIPALQDSMKNTSIQQLCQLRLDAIGAPTSGILEKRALVAVASNHCIVVSLIQSIEATKCQVTELVFAPKMAFLIDARTVQLPQEPKQSMIVNNSALLYVFQSQVYRTFVDMPKITAVLAASKRSLTSEYTVDMTSYVEVV